MFTGQILVFGASTTYGAWDKEGGWVQRLRKYLDERNLSDPNFYCMLYNLGVSGNTTEDLLERFEFETKQRLGDEAETIFIFAIGINDSQFVHSKNSLRTSRQEFRGNIQKLMDLAKKYSSKTVFVGPFPADEAKTIPVSWNKDKSYKNEYIKEYEEIIKSVCAENKIDFIEVFDKWMKMDYKKLLEDGLHPNSEGHEKIFETVKDYLIKNEVVL